MPVVHIYLADDIEDHRVRAIADGVHLAMVDEIGIPAADRFQVIHRTARADLIYDREFQGLERSDDFVLIEISLAAGRSVEVKELLYARITERLAQTASWRPDDVFVALHEVGIADFSLGGGIAQFVRNLPPHLRALES